MNAELGSEEAGWIHRVYGPQHPRIYRNMLTLDNAWDACQMPMAIVTCSFESFSSRARAGMQSPGPSTSGSMLTWNVTGSEPAIGPVQPSERVWISVVGTGATEPRVPPWRISLCGPGIDARQTHSGVRKRQVRPCGVTKVVKYAYWRGRRRNRDDLRSAHAGVCGSSGCACAGAGHRSVDPVS